MNSISKKIVKLALILILFQFFAPCFLPVDRSGNFPLEISQSVHTQHNSLVGSLPIKGKR